MMMISKHMDVLLARSRPRHKEPPSAKTVLAKTGDDSIFVPSDAKIKDLIRPKLDRAQ